MRVPISWLKDYVDVSLTVAELAEKLTLAGLEVEKIEYLGLPGSELPWDPDKIYVAQVLNVERHPNADKLLLVDLDYGASGGDARQIRVVTGAPNLAIGTAGQKVVLALKGSRLYDGHKEGKVITVLKEASLRGIKNDSMVCSEKELGISDEHDGIIILPDDAPVGTPLADYWGDAVLEVAILPNTIRCAGMIGIAREVAAMTGAALRYPAMNFVEDAPEQTRDLVKIEIRDPRLNPRFTAGLIKDVKLGPSPMWLQRRLQLAGVRAINNVVDVSNYVMLELGHPTHAFDYERIRSSGSEAEKSEVRSQKLIYTRLAEPGETLVTLDGVERKLLPTDIVVCDAAGATSLAGTMGGAISEVQSDTTTVLFEVASWNNISIRRTARFHDLNSEASFRFARGLHPDQAMLAQKRGLYLLQLLTGGHITHGIVDVYPQPVTPVQITLDPAYAHRIIGMDIPVSEMVRILRALEFEVEEGKGEWGMGNSSDPTPHSPFPLLQVTAPNHRLDIEGPHDLVEEIGRIYGYDRLPATLMRDELPAAPGNPQLTFEEQVKDSLVNEGLQEIVSYRMTTPEREARVFVPGTPVDDRPYVVLKNPINPERTVMRHSLMGNVLDALSENLRHHKQVRLFEVGSVYLPSEEGNNGAGRLPDETPRLCIALSGARDEASWNATAKDTAQPMDFYDAKGVVEALLQSLQVSGVTYEAVDHPAFFPGRTAAVNVEGRGKQPGIRLGVFGELHPLVREAWGLPDTPVLVADFDLSAVMAAGAQGILVQDIPRFPAVEEDLAVIVSEDVSAAEVAKAIQRAGGNLLSDARLFDVYRGEQIGAGKKSLAYSLTYQAEDRTLSDKDIEKARNKIIRGLETNLAATIRK